jgi:dienelactone hydrolase
VTLLARAGALAALALFASTAVARPPDVHLRVLRFIDRSRSAHFQTGASGPRLLVTEVRYPTRRRPPFPLIVFAHGFDLTPAIYSRLLDQWARAGYFVAAPVFPVENTGASGGPSRADLVNEPGDIRFVISSLIAATSPVRALVDGSRIAVAGQSDGAIAAFSAAYDRRYRDPRIDAAMVMSGGPLGGYLPATGPAPPLLAVQGTQDPFNPPSVTANYYRTMRRPKFLLWLTHASHLPPYTTDDRWATVVRRATTAFLNRYLRRGKLLALLAASRAPGVASITANP